MYVCQVVVEEVCMAHYAGNFLIYAATGVNFRSELCALARRWFPCVATGSSLRGITGTGNRNSTRAAALELRQTNMTALQCADEF